MKHFQVPLTLQRCITFIKESIVIIVINDIYFACESETSVPSFQSWKSATCLRTILSKYGQNSWSVRWNSSSIQWSKVLNIAKSTVSWYLEKIFLFFHFITIRNSILTVSHCMNYLYSWDTFIQSHSLIISILTQPRTHRTRPPILRSYIDI